MRRGKGFLAATWGKLSRMYGNVSEKTIQGTGARIWESSKQAIRAGAEETSEEIIENITNIWTGKAINNYWVEHAKSVKSRFGNLTYQRNVNSNTNEISYTEIYQGQPVNTISERDYYAQERALSHSVDILSGKSQMDTEFHTDEFYAAFIGSAMMGGAGSIFTYTKNKQVDKQKKGLGLDFKRNPA